MTKSVILGFMCTAKMEEKLKSHFMNPMHPVLATFSVMVIHPYNNYYAFFWFELMRHIPLGLSELLSDCPNEMLSDDTSF